MKRFSVYLINPLQYKFYRKIFGFFRFEPCESLCCMTEGFSVVFGFFGVSVVTREYKICDGCGGFLDIAPKCEVCKGSRKTAID